MPQMEGFVSETTLGILDLFRMEVFCSVNMFIVYF